MPVSDIDHFNLYCTLRNQILTRFFAYGRYFSTNALSLENSLGYLRASPIGPEPTQQDDPVLSCGENRRARVKPPDTEYRDAADLRTKLSANPGLANAALWIVSNHSRENPALYGAQLVAALTVECALGVGRGA